MSSPTPFPHGAFLPNGHQIDPPLPENDPTIGYKLNHFMLRIRDPKTSMHFYIDLMGMRTVCTYGTPAARHTPNPLPVPVPPSLATPTNTILPSPPKVFTMHVGPFTIYYLGYPQTPSHRSDLPKFGQDTSANLQHTLGLLELYHVHGSEKQDPKYYSTGNTPPHLGFGHLGFTVPDVPAALSRLEASGVPIIKPLNIATPRSIPISEWEESHGIGIGPAEIHPNYAAVFNNIAFVQDPDGYIVELVPQKMDPLDP